MTGVEDNIDGGSPIILTISVGVLLYPDSDSSKVNTSVTVDGSGVGTALPSESSSLDIGSCLIV